jgi:hypothetical protein
LKISQKLIIVCLPERTVNAIDTVFGRNFFQRRQFGDTHFSGTRADRLFHRAC